MVLDFCEIQTREKEERFQRGPSFWRLAPFRYCEPQFFSAKMYRAICNAWS